jgi:general L-amino acid transport system permease protein
VEGRRPADRAALPLSARRRAPWRSARARSIVIQAVVALAALAFLGWIASNVAANLARYNVRIGFDFLSRPAGFAVTQSLIAYSEASSYGAAFVVALLNTLVLSAAGIVVATMLGFVIGLARLSPNWLVARLAAVYIETLRNVPLLLQLFFWYFAILRPLPGPRQSLSLFDVVFLNNRGLYLPAPSFDGFALSWDVPVLTGFNFTGGIAVIPEFVAMLVALSTYSAAFVAEIVRGGVLSVPQGQIEAARALGLRRGAIYRLVVVPQALRAIVPPLTSQYLNLTKNSSLAAAIAYPDLMLVFAGTVLNQTGQPFEVMAITMGVYLAISLAIALLMNWYNRRTLLVERTS